MNEEIKNINTEEIEAIDSLEETEGMEYYEDSDCSGAGLIVLALGTAIGGAGAALYLKNKAKIEDWRIKRWEKKGYQITKIEEPIQEIEGEPMVEEPVDVPEEKPVKKTSTKKTKKEE